MAATSVYVPKGSSRGLLPLQEALQRQQVGLTQAPFKQLPLSWNSEHVRFSQCPLGAESLFPTALWPSCMQVLLAFKAKCSGGSCSWHRTPGLGNLTWGSDPSLLGWTSAIVIILPFMGHLPCGCWS